MFIEYMICIYSRSATLSSKNGNPIPGLPKPRPTSRLSQITAQPLRRNAAFPNTASLPYVVHEQRKHLHLDLHMKVKFITKKPPFSKVWFALTG